MKHVKKFNAEESKINEEIRTNYYKDQLDRIDLDSEYFASFKIKSAETDSETHWLDLNLESVEILIDWLRDKFYHVATPPKKQ